MIKVPASSETREQDGRLAPLPSGEPLSNPPDTWQSAEVCLSPEDVLQFKALKTLTQIKQP
ncbi:hypothetical protein NBRC116601_27490 [Cognatishimia sp. WU-CL00825]